MKSYEELTITDDFIFCKVMSDEKLCAQMIERLLNIQVDHIEYITRQGRLVYIVRQCFEELPGIKYNDNSHKVFYNLTAKELLGEDSKMGQFLRYLKNHLPTDDYTESIETAVIDAKYNRTWRKEYMTVNMKIWEEKERTMLKAAVLAVKECEANPKLIAEKFDIPLEELLYAVEHGIDYSEDDEQQ